MSTSVQSSTTSSTVVTSSAPNDSSTNTTSLLASMIAAMEAIYAMEGNYSTVMNKIAERQVESQQTLTTWQQGENKKLIHKIHKIQRKMKKASKWGKLAKVGEGIMVGASIAIAIASGGAGTALVIAAIGVMSMLPTKINPIDMAATELANQMGGGAGMRLLAKAIVIAAVIAISMGAGALDGASVAAKAGAEEGTATAASTTTAEATAMRAGKLAGAQVLGSLNPLADAMIKTARATGHDSAEVEMICTIVASILTMMVSFKLTLGASGEASASTLAQKFVGENGIAPFISLMRGVETASTAVTVAGEIGTGASEIQAALVEFAQADIQKLLSVLTQVIKQLNSMSSETTSTASQTIKGFGTYNQNISQEVNQYNFV